MGRCIYEKNTGEFIWKYTFGIQPSEQGRIYFEYGIGEYNGDIWEKIDKDDYTDEEIKEGLNDKSLHEINGAICYKAPLDQIRLKKTDINKLKALLPYNINKLEFIDKAFWYNEEFSTNECLNQSDEYIGSMDMYFTDMYKSINTIKPDLQFCLMIKRYIQFMSDNDLDEYIFEGEL